MTDATHALCCGWGPRRPSLHSRSPRPPAPTTSPDAVTLVVYDSFPTADTTLNDALAAFTADTGIDVEILVAGDTGTMLSKAALTAGNPEGDVMWGVDNTFLSRAVADGVFEPYTSPVTATFPAELTALVPNGEATPVDYGDVCVNYDVAWFADNGARGPDLARRPRRPRLRRPARRAEPGDLVTRAGVPARHASPSSATNPTPRARPAGRRTGSSSSTTASRSSTAGPRPTTSRSPRPAAATARSWSATDRARRPA